MSSFTAALAKETCRFGVTVNCIAPGFIETPMVEAIPPEIYKKMVTWECPSPSLLSNQRVRAFEPLCAPTPTPSSQLSMVPIGCAGKPKDIANAVCFFADEENDYATGSCMVVDGGMRAGL